MNLSEASYSYTSNSCTLALLVRHIQHHSSVAFITIVHEKISLSHRLNTQPNMAKQAMYTTVMTVPDIKGLRLVNDIREYAVIIIHLHSQHHNSTVITSVDQVSHEGVHINRFETCQGLALETKDLRSRPRTSKSALEEPQDHGLHH